MLTLLDQIAVQSHQSHITVVQLRTRSESDSVINCVIYEDLLAPCGRATGNGAWAGGQAELWEVHLLEVARGIGLFSPCPLIH